MAASVAPEQASGPGPGGLDARGAVAAVAEGRTSLEALLADAQARVAAAEPDLGAVVTRLDPPAGGGPGPLQGTIVGIKDLMAVAGAPRLCGAPGLVDDRPQPEHATVVARLVDAGATVIATLQTHQFAYGLITPQTQNPVVPDRIAGGSSGGPGAALAAGLVHGALGTDTGGSVRVPAACCGVVGLKTTRGLVPLTGVQPLAWSLDTVGPMAATVADTALLLEVIAGVDPADPDSVEAPPAAPVRPVEGLRIGVPTELGDAPIDDDVREVWETALDRLRGLGAQITSISLPSLPEAPPSNGRVLGAEALAVHEEALAAHPERFWPSVRERLEHAQTLGAATVARARRVGVLLRHELRLAPVDVLVTPTLPCRVPPVGAERIEVAGREEPTVLALTRMTNPWNLSGVPAGSVPAGWDRGGAPVGVQVVGHPFAEAQILEVMAHIPVV